MESFFVPGWLAAFVVLLQKWPELLGGESEVGADHGGFQRAGVSVLTFDSWWVVLNEDLRQLVAGAGLDALDGFFVYLRDEGVLAVNRWRFFE